MNPAPATPQLYMAARIAAALGVARQSITRRLAGAPASGVAVVQGREAAAWALPALPREIREQLSQEAAKRGFRGAEDLLQAGAAPWQCPVPLDQVKPQFLQRAGKLRDALALPLARQHNLSRGALNELGLAEFQKAFSYPLSLKQWRRLFDRAVWRDAGAENFQRLELFLDEAALRSQAPARESLKIVFLHRDLAEVLAHLENRTAPTDEDKQWLWDAVFAHYERLLEAEPSKDRQRAVKASLLDYLFSAVPGVAKTKRALREKFRCDLREWRDNGRRPGALADKRRLTSGNFRKPDFSRDERKITEEAIMHGGSESLAHRRLREQGALSPEFMEYYEFDPRRDKSRVPRTVREAITPQVKMCEPLHRGPWEAKMRGPYIPRDWSGVRPGDYFSADDVTWNHYFREQDAAGRWRIMRGECLVLTDLLTGYPLDFSLIPGHYNGEHVRGLVLKVHDAVGLPRKGFYFEKGVWASRLIEGDRTQGEAVHWREIELGLRDRGLCLDVRHATTPRAKPIEGLLHILQDRMRSIPGFVGFNERIEEMERIQALIARAHRNDEEALAFFPTGPQWRDAIRQVIQEFARDPQNGKMNPGRSPAEGWEAEMSQHPLKRLPEDARYILSTHKKVVTVRQEGIVLTIRGKRMLFCNEGTGKLIGQKALAFFNIEQPELLTVSDLNRQNHFTVKRIELPALSATPEQFADVHSQIKGHRATAKAIYGNVKHRLVSTVTRDSEHDEASKALGRFHNEAVAEHRAEQSATERKWRKIQTEALALGSPVPTDTRNPDRVLDALAWKREVLERIAREEAQAPQPE